MNDYKKVLFCWNKMEYIPPAPLPKDKNIVELVGSIPWGKPVIVLSWNSFTPIELVKKQNAFANAKPWHVLLVPLPPHAASNSH